MKHRLLFAVTTATLVVILIGGSTWLYWTFQPGNVIDVTNNPAPVRPDTINPEAVVIVSPHICKHIKAKANVQRSLVSNASVTLLPSYGNTLGIGCNTLDLPVIIPGNTPDGVYHLEYEITYEINPIRQVVETWQSQEFTVHHVPPLPVSSSYVAPTTNVTTTPSGTTTTTDDGKGNSTSTTTETPPKSTGPLQWISDFVNSLLGRKK